MILLFALILLFAMMIEDSPFESRKSKDGKPTTSQIIGTAGVGCVLALAFVILLFGILSSIMN